MIKQKSSSSLTRIFNKTKKIIIGTALASLPVATSGENSATITPMNNLPQTEITTPPSHLSDKTLFIGDSRTVGMFLALTQQNKNPVNDVDQNGNFWFAKVGEDIKWLKNNISTIQEKAQNCSIIVISLGVNDIAKSGGKGKACAEQYIQYLNELAEDWAVQGKSVFVSSCNPVSSRYTSIKNMNQQINIFNTVLKNGLSSDITFIDTNSLVFQNAKLTDYNSDGLHYKNKMNSFIYNIIMEQTEPTRQLLANQKELSAPSDTISHSDKTDLSFYTQQQWLIRKQNQN